MSNGLPIYSQERFESGWRLFERMLMTVLVLALAGALAGLFGRGLAARAESSGKEAKLSYDRFPHRAATSQVMVEARPVDRGYVDVALDRTLAERWDIKSVTPEAAVQGATDGVVYRFQRVPGVPARITLQIQPRKVGLARGVVTVDGRAMPIQQLIYP
jgi:hypothetical protein